MNIRYIQSNLSKLSSDNVIKFLYDLVLQNLQDINPYEQGKEYKKGDRVYLQENGKHQIFQCIEDYSSHKFINEEWRYILEVYNREIDKIYNLRVKEEVHVIDESTKNGIVTNLDFKYERSTVALFCGKKRYALNYDFTINDKNIDFIKPFNIGDKVILEVREFIGITVGIVIYSPNGIPYLITIDNNKDFSISKHTNSSAISDPITLTTGEHTYTLMVDDNVNPPKLRLYEDIETIITGTNNDLYNLSVKGSDVKLSKLDNVGFSDTKIFKCSDGLFYTLDIDNNGNPIATEVEMSEVEEFRNGLLTLDENFKIKNIDVVDGQIVIRDYNSNEGYQILNFIDIYNGNNVGLIVNENYDLELLTNYETNLSGNYPTEYFYFYDDNQLCNRMFVEDGELKFELAEEDVYVIDEGIYMYDADNELVNIRYTGVYMYINTMEDRWLNDSSFESPIEGFVVMVNGEKKLVTVDKESSSFILEDTDYKFKTNHHYVLSEDRKVYKLVVNEDDVSFIEADSSEFNLENVSTGAFIKSNDMITKLEINNDISLTPVSTFVHRIRGINGLSYMMDIVGEIGEERIEFRQINDESLSTAELYLRDLDENCYKVNIDETGYVNFELYDKIDGVDYEITSLIESTNGWYQIFIENNEVKVIKTFDNIFENTMCYGNIVRQDYIIRSSEGIDFSLRANGLGEIDIVNKVNSNTDGLLLLSTDNNIYGVGMMNDQLVTYKSYIPNSKPNRFLYVQDTVTGDKYKLSMVDHSLVKELINDDISCNEFIVILDVYNFKHKLEINDGKLVII